MDEFLVLAIQNYAQAELAQAQRNYLATAQCVPADGLTHAAPPVAIPDSERFDALIAAALQAHGTHMAIVHAMRGLLAAVKGVPGLVQSIESSFAVGASSPEVVQFCEVTADAYSTTAGALISALAQKQGPTAH